LEILLTALEIFGPLTFFKFIVTVPYPFSSVPYPKSFAKFIAYPTYGVELTIDPRKGVSRIFLAYFPYFNVSLISYIFFPVL
jgi:hypothetical protein